MFSPTASSRDHMLPILYAFMHPSPELQGTPVTALFLFPSESRQQSSRGKKDGTVCELHIKKRSNQILSIRICVSCSEECRAVSSGRRCKPFNIFQTFQYLKSEGLFIQTACLTLKLSKCNC